MWKPYEKQIKTIWKPDENHMKAIWEHMKTMWKLCGSQCVHEHMRSWAQPRWVKLVGSAQCTTVSALRACLFRRTRSGRGIAGFTFQWPACFLRSPKDSAWGVHVAPSGSAGATLKSMRMIEARPSHSLAFVHSPSPQIKKIRKTVGNRMTPYETIWEPYEEHMKTMRKQYENI